MRKLIAMHVPLTIFCLFVFGLDKSFSQNTADACKPTILGASGVLYETRMKAQTAKKIELPADCKMEIVSYEITFTSNQKFINKKKVGNTFDAGFVDIVNKADKEIYIENIKAKDITTGAVVKLKSVIIKFKN